MAQYMLRHDLIPDGYLDKFPKRTSKTNLRSSMSRIVNALSLWCWDAQPKSGHRWVIFSQTIANHTSMGEDAFSELRSRTGLSLDVPAHNIFCALKARVFGVSKNDGKGKLGISITVETPDLMVQWLQCVDTLAELVDIENDDKANKSSRLGSLVAKSYDFHWQGETPVLSSESPRRYLTLADYQMLLLIMIGKSPIVSGYHDMICELKYPHRYQTTNAHGELVLEAKIKSSEISLEHFIPNKIRWGVDVTWGPHMDAFTYAYVDVIFKLWHGDALAAAPHIHPLDILRQSFNNYPFQTNIVQATNLVLAERTAHCVKVGRQCVRVPPTHLQHTQHAQQERPENKIVHLRTTLPSLTELKSNPLDLLQSLDQDDRLTEFNDVVDTLAQKLQKRALPQVVRPTKRVRFDLPLPPVTSLPPLPPSVPTTPFVVPTAPVNNDPDLIAKMVDFMDS